MLILDGSRIIMKAGYVAIVGRPNSGKSTLLNNILGNKVSITSPKPQTTRFPIQALYEDDRGQIIFIDTPGVFGKVKDPVAARINPQTENTLNTKPAVVVYLVDHTRDRNFEENKILGLVRRVETRKIMAVNKIDVKKPTFFPHYKFMEEEFDDIVQISGLYKTNLNLLLDKIFALLPVSEKIITDANPATPLLNVDSKMFIAEIIREKAFLFLRKEVPYTLTCIVDEITPKNEKTLYIKARIITNNQKYKSMIIGEKGRMVKEIGMAARKELQTATSKSVFLELLVESNPHWHESL